MESDFDTRVQKKAEQHLDACTEALMEEGNEDAPPSPAYAPFCGCTTCVVREVLQVAWDEMLEEARREVAREGSP